MSQNIIAEKAANMKKNDLEKIYKYIYEGKCDGTSLFSKLDFDPEAIIGFVGTISARSIDINLVNSVAEQTPKWIYLFVGPCENDVKRRLECRNVFVLPAVNGKRIPYVIKSFDVGIIPYNCRDSSMDYVFPRKTCEFMAAGLPVVSTPLLEQRSLQPYVRIADTTDAFIDELGKAIESREDNNKVKLFAKQFDWNRLLRLLLKKIEENG